MRKVIIATGRTLVFCVCAFASLFLLLSGYESIYNRSLPFVHTIDPVNLSAFNAAYNLPAAAEPSDKAFGTFGKPQTIKLPARSLRLNVVPALKQGSDTWLGRASTLHLMIPEAPRSGNIGVGLLYCRASFRTLNDQNLPPIGSNIFMDTDSSWRYVYKVTSAKVFPDNDPHVIADDGNTGKLAIICNDEGRHTNVLVEATLLSVQRADR